MARDCPECRRKALLAAQMRGLADAILTPVAEATGLPAELVQGFVEGTTTGAVAAGKTKGSRRRKASAYAKAYGKAFKRVASKYKKKNGSWKSDGFKRAQKEAHRLAKRSRK